VIFIDYKDSRPICNQLVDRISSLAARGILTSGSQLPTVRQLALELSINPNTIQKAYSILEQNGIIVSVKGKGSFVSSDYEVIRQKHISSIDSALRDLVIQAAEIGYPENDFLSKSKEFFTNRKDVSDDRG